MLNLAFQGPGANCSLRSGCDGVWDAAGWQHDTRRSDLSGLPPLLGLLGRWPSLVWLLRLQCGLLGGLLSWNGATMSHRPCRLLQRVAIELEQHGRYRSGASRANARLCGAFATQCHWPGLREGQQLRGPAPGVPENPRPVEPRERLRRRRTRLAIEQTQLWAGAVGCCRALPSRPQAQGGLAAEILLYSASAAPAGRGAQRWAGRETPRAA